MSAALESVAPGLTRRLEQTTPTKQRACAIAAARAALMHTSLMDRRVEAVMTGRFGDSPERRELQILNEELDNAAWTVQDRVQRGTAAEEEYFTAFRRARAASACWHAVDRQPLRAALESAYEAHYAIDDAEALRHVIDRVLEEE